MANENSTPLTELFFNTDSTTASSDAYKPPISKPDRIPMIEPDIETRYKMQPVEVKTKRFNLIMQPSVYKMARLRSADLGLSTNEYIHELIRADFMNGDRNND